MLEDGLKCDCELGLHDELETVCGTFAGFYDVSADGGLRWRGKRQHDPVGKDLCPDCKFSDPGQRRVHRLHCSGQGGYDAIATQTTNNWNNCGPGPTIPEGTVLPNGRAISLLNQFAVDGSSLLTTTVNSTLPNIRAYATNKGSGYTILLINLDENNAANATIGLSNGVSQSYSATTTTYGKAQYDDSITMSGLARSPSRWVLSNQR